MTKQLQWAKSSIVGAGRLALLCLMLLMSSILELSAQSKTITGVVLDAKTKEAIIGASVVEIGTSKGIQTNLDGKFTLVVDAKSKIRITYVGYQAQVIPVATFKGQTLNIALEEVASALNEVVVTAYGGRQLRTKVTNSIAKVDKDALKQGMFANPAQALSGAVAGLRVTQSSGDPGAAPSIVLRGGTDFNGGGSPLVLVDGQVRGMNDINPNDIESMEVLKDAGATAIYGARANNGVILITTKRGQKGSSEISFSTKLGLSHFRSGYEFLGARDYIHWMRMAYVNGSTANWKDAQGNPLKHPDGTALKTLANVNALDQAQPFGTGNRYFAADGKTPLDGNQASNAIWSTMAYSDELAFLLEQGWQKMDDPAGRAKNGIIFTENRMEDFNIQTPTLSQDYNINMRGGNDRGSYYAGLGYNHSNGSVYGNWYQRMTFVINADYKLKPWLKSESGFSFADAKWNGMPPTQTNQENYFSRGFSVPPTFRGYNANGEELLGTNSGDGNQRFNFHKFIRDNNTTKFTLNQALTINFMKDLSLKLSGIWYYSDGKYESFNKDYLQSPGTWNRARSSSASYSRTLDQTYNAILNYHLNLGKHSLDAMAGFEYYDSYYKGFSASGSGAPTDDFMALNYTLSEKDKRNISSSHSRNRIMSFFGRLNYDYQDKYLLSLVVRRDGYSRLVGENRWGVFPGVSAGWVFGKEKFAKDALPWLSFGKLRASYGLNGNVNPSWVGPYTVQGSYSSAKYNGDVGFLLNSLPNPYLQWEKSRTFEVGADLGFLGNRINANITYYDRLTIDKFANITIPSVSGINSIASNNGEFLNRGLEFELAFRIIDTQDFKWRLAWNGAYNKSRVVKLPFNKKVRNQQGAFEVYTGNGDEKMWVGGYQEGQTPGDMYAYQADGIYQSEDEIPAGLINTTGRSPLYGGKEGYDKLDAAQKKNSLPIRPGDIRWRDVNGDGKIDQFDRVYVGNNTPKWTGGINTSFSWKGLTLSARFDYALGFTIIDSKTPWIMGAAQGTYNTIKESMTDTWSPSNPNAKYPSAVWADFLGKDNYRSNSTLFTYKGDYLSFREVSLSYALPKIWIKKLHLERLELSVTGQNLGYWTQGKHIFSPERGGYTNGGYPLPRIVVFGANLTF